MAKSMIYAKLHICAANTNSSFYFLFCLPYIHASHMTSFVYMLVSVTDLCAKFIRGGQTYYWLSVVIHVFTCRID